MNSKKTLPIVIMMIMLCVCAYLFFNRKKTVETFDKLQVTYNNETKDYEGTYGEKIIIGNVELTITSVNSNEVVLIANQYILINGKESSTMEVKMGTNDACISNNDCFVVTLS